MNLTAEHIEQIKKMEDFIKEAFCVERCTYIKTLKVDSRGSMLFSLYAKDRGIFYVTISK